MIAENTYKTIENHKYKRNKQNERTELAQHLTWVGPTCLFRDISSYANKAISPIGNQIFYKICAKVFLHHSASQRPQKGTPTVVELACFNAIISEYTSNSTSINDRSRHDVRKTVTDREEDLLVTCRMMVW